MSLLYDGGGDDTRISTWKRQLAMTGWVPGVGGAPWVRSSLAMSPEPVPSLLHGIVVPETRSQPWQGSELCFLLLGFVISCLVAAGSWLARANSLGELTRAPGPKPTSLALPAQPATDSSGFSQVSPHWETALIKWMGWFELISPNPEG